MTKQTRDALVEAMARGIYARRPHRYWNHNTEAFSEPSFDEVDPGWQGLAMSCAAAALAAIEAAGVRLVPVEELHEMRQLELAIPAYGAVQGVVHAWFKEAREPYFTARELSTGALVKVLYKPNDYTKVVSAVRHRTTILIAAGLMKYDKVSQQALEMRADRIDVMGSLSPEAFEALVGSAPEVEFDLGD